MSGLEWALVGVVALLAALVLVAVGFGVRTLNRLTSGALPGRLSKAGEHAAFAADADRHEQSLAALRGAAEDATAAVDEARAVAAAARTEAATAKAEASAARAEAS